MMQFMQPRAADAAARVASRGFHSRRSGERFNLIGIYTASASSTMIKEEELPFRWLINADYECAIRGLLLASSM
jgi:hypothetical protein